MPLEGEGLCGPPATLLYSHCINPNNGPKEVFFFRLPHSCLLRPGVHSGTWSRYSPVYPCRPNPNAYIRLRVSWRLNLRVLERPIVTMLSTQYTILVPWFKSWESSIQGLCWPQRMGTLKTFSRLDHSPPLPLLSFVAILLFQPLRVARVKWPASSRVQTCAAQSMSVVRAHPKNPSRAQTPVQPQVGQTIVSLS